MNSQVNTIVTVGKYTEIVTLVKIALASLSKATVYRLPRRDR